MKRLLVLLMLTAVSMSVTAATTVKSSKSNASDREQAPATTTADEGSTPDTVGKKPTTVNGSKSDRHKYKEVLTQQGRVQATPFGANQPNATPGLGQPGQPGPAESSNLNSSRSNTFRTETGSHSATPSPGPAGTILDDDSSVGERDKLKGSTKDWSNTGGVHDHGANIIEYKDGEDGVARTKNSGGNGNGTSTDGTHTDKVKYGGTHNGDLNKRTVGVHDNGTLDANKGGVHDHGANIIEYKDGEDGVNRTKQPTTVNTSHSNSYRLEGGKNDGAPAPAESSNLNSGRTNTFRTQMGQPGTPSPVPMGSIQLNSSRAGVYRTEAGQPGAAPNPGPAAVTTINSTKSNTFRRGTPETNPPKPSAAGSPSAEPDKPAQDQKPFHF